MAELLGLIQVTLPSPVTELKQFVEGVKIMADDYSLHPAERCQKLSQLADEVLSGWESTIGHSQADELKG